MLKYLTILLILLSSNAYADAKSMVGAKGNYLCLAARVNRHIKELQPLYYGKDRQLEAVYCVSVKGDYIVLKENQANLTVFKDVEIVDNLIVGKTNEREIIVQPQTDKYKLDNEYAQFVHSEVAKHRRQLSPESIKQNGTNLPHAIDNNDNASGEIYAD